MNNDLKDLCMFAYLYEEYVHMDFFKRKERGNVRGIFGQMKADMTKQTRGMFLISFNVYKIFKTFES